MVIEKVYNLLEGAAISTLNKFEETLPDSFERQDRLDSYGYSFINQFFKESNEIEIRKANITDEGKKQLMLEQEKILYHCYMMVGYGEFKHFNFEEFIMFSKLICLSFQSAERHSFNITKDDVNMILSIIKKIREDKIREQVNALKMINYVDYIKANIIIYDGKQKVLDYIGVSH